MLATISDTALVSFKTGALKDEITYGSLTLHVDGNVNPELFASVDGTVRVANNISDVEGNLISPGDHLAISYKCVGQYEWIGDRKHFKNEVTIDGERLFKVRKDFLLAVKRDSGWVAIGQHVLMQEIIEEYGEVLELPGVGVYRDTSKGGVVKGRAKFISGDVEGVQKDNIVIFDPKYHGDGINYDFSDGSRFMVLPSRYILAKA